MKKGILLLVACALALVAFKAQAVSMNWVNKTCVVIDSTFKVCKPNTTWDTQKTKDSLSPIKWVYHQDGANPIIWLRYDAAEGKTAHDYAQTVKERLAIRGIKVNSINNTNINGRNVSILSGANNAGDRKYLVGVWRNQAKGISLECGVSSGDFGKFKDQCMESIQSVRIVSEGK